MHPFALNDEQLDNVSGGVLRGVIGTITIPTEIKSPFPIKDEELTTMAMGEEGGSYVDLT